MNRNRPAPNRSRPEPSADATNVPVIVDQVELFGASRGAYGGVEFSDPAPEESSSPGQDCSGAVRRDVGHRRASSPPASAAYVTMGERWVRERIAAGALELDAEMLRRDLGEPPSSASFGVIFRRCALQGLIAKGGTRLANRPEAHGRDLRIWVPRHG